MRKPDAQATLLIAFIATLLLAFGLNRYGRPPDFRAYADAAQRKQAFVSYLCPMIEEANAAAAADRSKVLRAKEQLHGSGTVDQVIFELGDKYGLTLSVAPTLLIDRLLRRVGELPPALVIAQAAIESGWGTSELFARYRNLFGRRCFYASECYIEATGNAYRIFASAGESVARYFQDLNTLMPYKRLRDLRAQNIDDPRKLAEGLSSYSSRGSAYVRQLKGIMDEAELRHACSTS